MSQLPVTVISPVMNCVRKMPSHAEHLKHLSETVKEIIVVDSHSEDGTKEYLQDALSGYDVRFLDHPPGLYPSWNFGVSHATQRYLTFATVGDILTSASLKKLYKTIESHAGDVVISPPSFVSEAGQSVRKRWPIHLFLEGLKPAPSEPFVMDPVTWVVATYGLFSASLISSSSGNLYRTSLLQAHPFPEDLGHWGDCAWALLMGSQAKWVIDPLVASTMSVYPHSKARLNTHNDAFDMKRASLASDFLKQHWHLLVEAEVSDAILQLLEESVEQTREKHAIRSNYKKRPLRMLPWFVDPYAIRLRKKRNRTEVQIQRRRKEVLGFLSSLWNGRDFGLKMNDSERI